MLQWFIFFSSRRWHTRFDCDWSSDVCSSDLIAKVLFESGTATGGSAITGTGITVGTAEYMSPEQASGEKRIDARSDVYALAAVLYEMLAGEPPFTGPSAPAIVAPVLADSPRPIHPIPPNLPAHIDPALT